MSNPSSSLTECQERDELQPLVEELSPAPEAEDVFLRLAGMPHCLFLDSSRRNASLGRYSFVAADPFEFITRPIGSANAIADMGAWLAPFRATACDNLPPFQGGAAGLFSYDLGRQLERLPRPQFDEFGVPALAVGLYDVVVAFDHVQERAWLISQGLPLQDSRERRKRAEARLRQFRDLIHSDDQSTRPQSQATNGKLIDRKSLAPQFAVPGPDGLTSNFDGDGYLRTVQRAIEYIRAGDVFQVNLAQRLLFPADGGTVDLYLRLRRRNAATFAGYFDLGSFQLLSASPERFLRVAGRDVEARPIKGTCQRTARPEADLFAGDDLMQSEKDRAENVMIVDLLRNDLSRVCGPGSINVTDLCRLESYEYVQHLVSVIRGRLAEGLGPLDLLRATFPGGSITGAPKVRAMEIIAELEPTARGAYCGSLGYVGFDGAMDTNILIRTITAGGGWWQAPVGGGIVAQSIAEQEYEETWHKAEGLLRAFRE